MRVAPPELMGALLEGCRDMARPVVDCGGGAPAGCVLTDLPRDRVRDGGMVDLERVMGGAVEAVDAEGAWGAESGAALGAFTSLLPAT